LIRYSLTVNVSLNISWDDCEGRTYTEPSNNNKTQWWGICQYRIDYGNVVFVFVIVWIIFIICHITLCYILIYIASCLNHSLHGRTILWNDKITALLLHQINKMHCRYDLKYINIVENIKKFSLKWPCLIPRLTLLTQHIYAIACSLSEGIWTTIRLEVVCLSTQFKIHIIVETKIKHKKCLIYVKANEVKCWHK
jgi:hypothetical protein